MKPGRVSSTFGPRTIGALALCALLAGCTTSELALNPLWVGTEHATSGDGEETFRARSLGPLFDYTRGPDYREIAVHPLFRSVRTGTDHEVQVLDPIVNYRATSKRTSFRITPLISYRGYRPVTRAPEWDFMMFPFLFMGGGTEAHDRYFALFPIAGRIGNFATFEASFFLFPLFYKFKKDVRSPETFYHITPLIGWTSGGGRDGSWRFLPFYGHWKSEGKYSRKTFLWPFFHYHRTRLDKPDPGTLVAFWPLFKIDKSARHSFKTFLWPLFRFNREEVPARAGKPAEVYFRHDIPWPIYKRERNREFERLRVFPFFSRYRSENLDSDAYAIPLFWKRQLRSKEWTRDTLRFVPFFMRQNQRYHDGRPSDRQTRVWPLFSYNKKGNGERTFRALTIVPLELFRFTGDMEANWGPLFELYYDRRGPDGSRDITALLRLFQYSHEPGRTRWSIPLLYSGHKREGRTTHDLLWGLIRFGSGRGGAELRLLFLPILKPEEAEQ